VLLVLAGVRTARSAATSVYRDGQAMDSSLCRPQVARAAVARWSPTVPVQRAPRPPHAVLDKTGCANTQGHPAGGAIEARASFFPGQPTRRQ